MRRGRPRRIEAGHEPRVPQHPERLFRRPTGAEIRPADERCGNRQGVSNVVGRTAAQREQHAAVVVADVGDAAAIVGEQAGSERHVSDGFLERGGHRILGNACDGKRQQIEVERVAVIVRRSLAVPPVCFDL